MLLALLACTPEPAPQVEDTVASSPEDTGDPAAYVYVEDEEDVEPLLELAQLEAGVGASLATLWTIDPRPFHREYETLRAHADGDCPYYYDYYFDTYGQHYWVDTCTTTDGTRFSGNGRSYDYQDYVNGDYQYRDYSYFYGSAKLVTSDGETLSAAGYSSVSTYTHSNGYDYVYQRMWGDFRWDAPEAEGTWLQSDLSLDLYLSISEHPDYGKWVSISSSMAGMDDLVNAVVFDSVVLFDEGRGSACAIEPAGTISLRDDDGEWYDVSFQGPRSGATTMFPPDCDGCGEVWWRGRYLGEVCPDFSSVLGWEEVPWN